MGGVVPQMPCAFAVYSAPPGGPCVRDIQRTMGECPMERAAALLRKTLHVCAQNVYVSMYVCVRMNTYRFLFVLGLPDTYLSVHKNVYIHGHANGTIRQLSDAPCLGPPHVAVWLQRDMGVSEN